MKKLPNTYVIIALLIVLCAVLTWFVPGGQYVTAGEGALTYEEVGAVPQTKTNGSWWRLRSFSPWAVRCLA